MYLTYFMTSDFENLGSREIVWCFFPIILFKNKTKNFYIFSQVTQPSNPISALIVQYLLSL